MRLRHLLIPVILLLVVPYGIVLALEIGAGKACRAIERLHGRACRWIHECPR